MGWLSSIGSVISSGISAVGSAISSAVSSIGSAVSSFASTVAPIIGTAIAAIPKIASTLANIAQGVLQAFGIMKPNEKIEEMGERALQAAQEGITPDKFENFDEYMEELRNFDLDEDKANKRTSTEKIVAGIAVGTVGLEKKLDLSSGEVNGLWLLPLANSEYFTADKLIDLLEGELVGVEIEKYLEKDLTTYESRELEKKLAVGMNEEEAGELYEALDESRKSYQQLAEEVNQKLA